MPRKLLAAAICALAVLGSTVEAANYKPLESDPKELVFGIISTESTQTLRNQWGPFLADMQKALGMKVQAFFAPDYAGVIEGMRFGKVHLAWFGNKSGMEAVDRAGAEVFAQQIKADGEQGYYSHILVSKDNDKINSLKDLLRCDKSIDFGIGDPNSTSGFLVPSFYVFAQNNVDPKSCFRTMRTANHETNFMAVANKQVVAATNNSEQLGIVQKKQPGVAAKVKVIWTSPQIPADPMVYRRDLSKDLKARIKGFFLTYGRLGPDAAKERAVLAKIGDGLGPFTDSSNNQLLPIRQLQLFRDKLKIEADTRLDAKEKMERLKGIESELAELNVLSTHAM